jgi:hypothetical protein
MKHRIRAHTFITGLCWLFLAGAALSQPALTKDEIARLKQGKIILKETKPQYMKQYSNTPWAAITYFDMTPAQAAGVILDFHQYRKIFPKVKDLDIYPLGDSRYRLKYRVASGIFTFNYTVIMTYSAENNMIYWDLDPDHPGDFSVYKGYWKFVKEGAKTLGIYSISPITNLPFPDFVQQEGAKNEMPLTVQEVKDWIKKMPTQKPGEKETPWPDEKKEENRLLKYGL